jgi:N-acyl-D-aspartate/D-glutamate deacylase
MRAQVATRAIGILAGLQGSVNPLMRCPTYKAVAGLPLAERVERLSPPEVRAALATELVEHALRSLDVERLYVLDDIPDYEPDPSDSIADVARRAGRRPEDELVDQLLARGGTALVYHPALNYADGNLDAVGEMLADPFTIPGLGDGGAHVGTICDASFPTTLLAHWGRDRRRGPTFDVAWLVRRHTHDTAAALGFGDRGALVPGRRADVNVIDFEHLRVRAPRLSFDLPAGGKRLLQPADGYLRTFVAGVETQVDGVPTGAAPGRLVRGARPAIGTIPPMEVPA